MGLRHNIPYSSIIDQFVSASNANLGIATFDTGTLDFLDANAVNKSYPYIYLRPLPSQGVVDRIKGNTFELYSMDVPKLSDESPVDILSQCEERIYQLLAWFNQGTTDIQQVYEVNITDLSPVNEAFQDRVYGWVATIDVFTPFRWDYCDYPDGITPTPTPVPSPVAPTPSPAPTAPLPTYYEFLISDTNVSSSLSGACDEGTEPLSTVYTPYDGQGDMFPINTIGKQIYTDQDLTIPYTASATDDDDYYRLAFAEGEYGTLHVEWYNFTGSNLVLDAQGCSFPDIETKDDVPLNETASLMVGEIVNFVGRTLTDYAFYWGTTSGSLTNYVSGSAIDVDNTWSASLQLPINATYYYRVSAKDADTGFEFLGNVKTIQPVETVFGWFTIPMQEFDISTLDPNKENDICDYAYNEQFGKSGNVVYAYAPVSSSVAGDYPCNLSGSWVYANTTSPDPYTSQSLYADQTIGNSLGTFPNQGGDTNWQPFFLGSNTGDAVAGQLEIQLYGIDPYGTNSVFKFTGNTHGCLGVDPSDTIC